MLVLVAFASLLVVSALLLLIGAVLSAVSLTFRRILVGDQHVQIEQWSHEDEARR